VVLYFGDPAGALALLARGVALCGVVLGRGDAPGEEALLRRIAGLPRWVRPRLSDPELQAELASLAPQLLVSGFYPRRIPAPVLALAPGLNVHPSDLPRGRGPDPIYWTVRRGETATALCVHWLTEELDAGDVVAREPVAVDPEETAGKLAERLEARGAELLAEVAQRWLASEELPAEPQTGEPSWAPFARRDALLLDPTLPPAEVHRAVLAGSPWPGARLHLRPGDPYVEVLEGAPRDDLPPFGPPGAVRLQDGELLLACAGGAYALTTVRRGSKMFWGYRLARLLPDQSP